MAEEQDRLSGGSSTASSGAGSGRTERMRRDIEETRASIDTTVDELSERLKPRHLVDELLDYFNSKSGDGTVQNSKETAKRLGTAAFDRLKAHPMPAALITAGVVWLIAEESRRRSRSARASAWMDDDDFGDLEDYYYSEGSYSDDDEDVYDVINRNRAASSASSAGTPSYSTEGENFQSHSGQESHSGQGIVGRAREAIHHATERVSETVGHMGETVRGSATHAGERAAMLREQARQRAAAARRYAAESTQHLRERAHQTYEYGRSSVEQHPLAAAGMALAAGMLLGFLIPNTSPENRYLGPTAEELRRRARRYSKDVMEKGRTVARAAMDSALDESKRQGLYPEQMVGNGSNGGSKTHGNGSGYAAGGSGSGSSGSQVGGSDSSFGSAGTSGTTGGTTFRPSTSSNTGAGSSSAGSTGAGSTGTSMASTSGTGTSGSGTASKSEGTSGTGSTYSS